MNTNLGAIPLSADILEKANIGLWAFELDEGCEPRMYVDDVMLGLIGLWEQTTPEKTYHAWYDHIDPDHYDEVAASVEKMTAGVHAEVQYPWHHPDGHTMIVRCGGVRNPAYKKGIRIEGTHMDVTEVLHFTKEELERQHRVELELGHAQLRADLLSYASEYDGDPVELLKRFAERLRVLIGCDQVIYRDLYETRIMVNSPEIEPLWSVPIEYCMQCEHFDANHPMYRNGVTEMSDCSKGFEGIPTYHECPIKSSLTRIVYLDGKPDGYLAIHYVVNYHEFTQLERDTLEELTKILSVTLSRYVARTKNIELQREVDLHKQILEQSSLTRVLLSDYIRAVYVRTGETKEDDTSTALIESSYLISTIPGFSDGIPFSEQLSLFMEKYVHPDDEEMFYKMTRRPEILKGIHEHLFYNVDFRTIEEGQQHFVQMRFTNVGGQNGDYGFVCGLRRTDKEKEAENTLKEALAMAQSANRAKTTFLNNMSHDIRTPMNAIIGYTGLAATHIDSKELVRDYLSKIGQSSEHLLSLINDVLDMSRIESGKMNITEKRENISEIIHTLRSIVQADVKSKQLDFFIDSVDVVDENVICDKLRLNQVLLNILSNAIKYTPAGGTVSLRITEKSAAKNGYGTYEFRVKDNGIGMSEEFLKTIFDPFTRVKSSTVSGIQGTGLGMAITKNIIDMMGGTIEVQSEENAGTEVIINFDLKLAEGTKEIQIIPQLAGLRGLVVDDDSTSCISIQRMLRDAGMRAEWCVSGREAVIRTEAAIQDNDLFKVYIIDWLMPDMNGIETTRRIRRVVGSETPIVILTAYDWSDVEQEAKEAGVTAFISKPLFPSDLHIVLEKCCGVEESENLQDEDVFDFTGKKILLVEDNEMNREIAVEILEEAGFVVDTAEDGDIAVEKVRNDPEGKAYDIVLMDIQMPRIDGYEATRLIRALPPKDMHIPIIAMTANAFEEDKKAAIEAGMDEHIAKPIDVKNLKKTLAKYLK